jgi:hypothetical protein
MWNMEGFLSENRSIRTLREILTRLQDTYCGNIGFEVGPGLGGVPAAPGTGQQPVLLAAGVLPAC